jgi:hypothetical protein
VTRLIISLFLLAYAFTSLSAAAGTAVWLDLSDGHAGHELHIPGHEDDGHDDEAEHHFCHHNLLGLAINLPVPGATPPRAERLLEPPDLYRFECLQRLLRPPRR